MEYKLQQRYSYSRKSKKELDSVFQVGYGKASNAFET